MLGSLGSCWLNDSRSTCSSQEKKNGPNSPAMVGPLPGWRSIHKRYTSRDHTLLRQLEAACGGSEQASAPFVWLRTSTSPYLSLPVECVASETLRQHFTARTTALLVPLQRYLQTLIPTPTESRSPLPAGARLKPFHDAAFFSSLKAHGSPLPFKSSSKQREFYERWLRTPAFGLWLARQEEVVQGVLNGLM